MSPTFQYDLDADVMYFTMGTPREAISEEVAAGVFERRDPQSNEVVGVTITDFAKRRQARAASVGRTERAEQN